MQPQRKRQRSKALKDAGATWCFDAEQKQHSLVVRSVGPIDKCLSVTLVLAEPTEGEECMVAMEPIAEYRLPFMKAEAWLHKDTPTLTKATLPCGHGFSALALLYHFAKNSMTCPCCRAGHDKTTMGLQSVPAHLRKEFATHLESVRADETREQIASDAIAATRAMEHEVRLGVSLPMTRVVLSLHAFESMDSSEPRLVLEIPLTSSLALGNLAFASYGYYLHQLNLNLRLLPTRPRAFELAVGMQNIFHGSMPLFKTVRFPAEGAGHRIVFASGNETMAVEVETALGSDNYQVFTRLCWGVPVSTFSNILLNVARNVVQATEI
jgi:hypothetical protein